MTGERTIYICDDHRLFLESIEIFFGLKDGYRCIGHAENIAQSSAAIRQLQPDIVLIDYHLKDENGLQLLENIGGYGLHSHCFMLTMKRDAYIRNKAKALGARGYLLKTIGAEEMLKAFEMCMADQHYFYDALGGNGDAVSANQATQLTNRELEIARLVCKELSSEQIANMLFLSLHTVNTHRKNILKKLNAKNAIDIMNHLKQHDLHKS
jgi:DNA-binding NarL/FixJ family response regulator